MSRLRLDLIVRTYEGAVFNDVAEVSDKWTWRLWSGSRIVSTSGSQFYSRRIDCARGAEVGAGLHRVAASLSRGEANAYRNSLAVPIRVIDERAKP